MAYSHCPSPTLDFNFEKILMGCRQWLFHTERFPTTISTLIPIGFCDCSKMFTLHSLCLSLTSIVNFSELKSGWVKKNHQINDESLKSLTVIHPTLNISFHFNLVTLSDFAAMKTEMFTTQCNLAKTFNRRREHIFHGTFSTVEAQLNCMSDLVSASNKWRYVIKITSRDFPIVPNAQLVTHLKNLRNKNFIPAFRVTVASNQHLDSANSNGRQVLEDLMYKHQLEARDGMIRFR